MNPQELIETIQRLKASLIQTSTGGSQELNNAEYSAVRKALLYHPDLGPKVPEWLRRGATHSEAVSIIRDEAGESPGKWQRRREVVWGGLNPLIDALESSDIRASESLERLDRLGGGGFGEVYRYRHKLLGMDFALKILNPAFASDASHAVERFFQEARILFRLKHDHIVRVFDVGVLGRRPFIRMELIDGKSLARVIQDHGGMIASRARAIVHGLATALGHAHDEVRVVHRDLKPSNVMLENSGRAVIVDFGLGVFVEGDIASRITRTGEAAAGGLYTSPELVANPKLLDPKTDVYSLAAIWYELLLGRAPGGGTRIAECLAGVQQLSGEEMNLILACLGPLQSRPRAAEVALALRDPEIKL